MKEGGRGGHDTKETVVQFLVGTGLARPVADVVERRGRLLRRRMTRAGGEIELASMFDASDGVPVGRIMLGESKEVDISAYFRAMRIGRRYVVLHTHPGSSPFSLRDMTLFLETRRLSHSLVIGTDGTWFALSRRGQGSGLTTRHARLLIATAFERWRPPFEAAVHAGTLKPQQALDRLLDQLWRRLSLPLGVRYDTSKGRTTYESDESE